MELQRTGERRQQRVKGEETLAGVTYQRNPLAAKTASVDPKALTDDLQQEAGMITNPLFGASETSDATSQPSVFDRNPVVALPSFGGSLQLEGLTEGEPPTP